MLVIPVLEILGFGRIVSIVSDCVESFGLCVIGLIGMNKTCYIAC